MRKLPVTEAFSHSFRSTTNNLAFAFHVSWPWMLVLLPVLIAGNIYMLANMPNGPGEFAFGIIAFGLLLALLQSLAFASIAVNWHRYVLLDEMPQGAQRLRVDWTVWRYFGNILLISLIVGLCLLPVGILVGIVAAITGGGSIEGPEDFASIALIAIPVYAIMGTIGFALFYRYGVKLPAIALERRDFGLGDAWKATRGNFGQMIGLSLLYILIVVVVLVANWILAIVMVPLGDGVGGALGIAVQLVLQWVMTIFGITLLTSLYGYFVENRNF
jgi:hypothetical protein